MGRKKGKGKSLAKNEENQPRENNGGESVSNTSNNEGISQNDCAQGSVDGNVLLGTDESNQGGVTLKLDRATAFWLVDKFGGHDEALVNDVLSCDSIVVPLNYNLERLLFDQIKSVSLQRSSRSPPVHAMDAEPNHLAASCDPQNMVLEDLHCEFPEFPVHSIRDGLVAAKYDAVKVRRALVALSYRIRALRNEDEVLENEGPIAGWCASQGLVKELSGEFSQLSVGGCPTSNAYHSEGVRPLSVSASPRNQLLNSYHRGSYAGSDATGIRRNVYYGNDDWWSTLNQSYNSEVYDMILTQRYNKFLTDGIIDTHGLTVNQAIEAVDMIICPEARNLQVHSHSLVEVITGRGAHSYRNEPRIKNALVEYLKMNNIEVVVKVGSILFRPW